MVANIVKFKGNEYLDGGIADSVLIIKAEELGCDKNIVVLTRHKGYRKRASKSYLTLKTKYKKYPKIINKTQFRHKEYNEVLNYIDKRVEEGKAFVIQPKTKLNVGRLEKNKSKLEEAYNEGIG